MKYMNISTAIPAKSASEIACVDGLENVSLLKLDQTKASIV